MISLHISEPGVDVSLTVLPGCIFLTGTAGYQVFKTGTNYIPSKNPNYGDSSNQKNVAAAFSSDFKAIFNNKDAVEKSAEFYTEGHTNKDRFKAGVERLLDLKKITAHDRNRLRQFIDSCDCVPSRVRKKLAVAGFPKLVDKIDFADRDPRLDATVDVLWNVISK